MKKKELKKLRINKENVVTLNNIVGGAIPTTQQSTVVKVTKKGYLCEMTPAVCPTNWFDC